MLNLPIHFFLEFCVKVYAYIFVFNNKTTILNKKKTKTGNSSTANLIIFLFCNITLLQIIRYFSFVIITILPV